MRKPEIPENTNMYIALYKQYDADVNTYVIFCVIYTPSPIYTVYI